MWLTSVRLRPSLAALLPLEPANPTLQSPHPERGYARKRGAIFNIDQWFMVLDKQRFIDCSPIYRSLFDFLFLSLYF